MTEHHPLKLNIAPSPDGTQIRMTFTTADGDVTMAIPNNLGPSVLLGVSAAGVKNLQLAGRTDVALFSPKQFGVGLRDDRQAYVLDFYIGDDGARFSFAVTPEAAQVIADDLGKLKESLT